MKVLSELDAFEADLDHFVVSSGDRCGPEERFVLAARPVAPGGTQADKSHRAQCHQKPGKKRMVR